MVLASPPSRRLLAGEDTPCQSPAVPLTAIGPDKIEQSGFRNFEQELLVPVHLMWQHILVTPLEN
jgi:hypothetical protein